MSGCVCVCVCVQGDGCGCMQIKKAIFSTSKCILSMIECLV
jgi:hypothetical protein